MRLRMQISITHGVLLDNDTGGTIRGTLTVADSSHTLLSLQFTRSISDTYHWYGSMYSSHGGVPVTAVTAPD
jgi:hypothetical protein